ncbi:adenylyltransferase/cytidyltransferase family protein [Deinococcus sp.]|uniref:adenylyltransferase/cytidyltransferase family protein n=1 Tax=Deinococcus sp. TaxID=47478 RepID=UPI003B59C942
MLQAVYIGRFEPLHNGHLANMLSALAQHDRLHLLLGSANLARSSKNPWTAAERARIIRAALREAGGDLRRVRCSPIPDEFDAGRWAAQVRRAVGSTPAVLVGSHKDVTSQYLKWFPEWPLALFPVWPGLGASTLRAAYFEGGNVTDVPAVVQHFLETWQATPTFRRLQAEHRAIQKVRVAWDGEPRCELLFLDLQHGQLRVERRSGAIGRGLWALPGRPLAAGEAAPGKAHVFAAPARSLTVPTTAYVVSSPSERPALTTGLWLPLSAALERPRRFFEDHQVIVRRMLEAQALP